MAFSIAALAIAAQLTLVPPESPVDPVAVVGLPEGAAARIEAAVGAPPVLVVTVDAEGDLPAVFGVVSVVDGAVLFRPRHTFVPGVLYRVRFRFEDLALDARFEIAAAAVADTARVAGVHPTADELPQNTLRFYIHFTEPMAGGDVARHIRLENSSGAVIEQAFVEPDPELWDRDRRRLTLILHPGRIKQGLAMRERLGPPISAGLDHTLVIEAGMRTAAGGVVGSTFRKAFRGLAADRTSPAPAQWRAVAPVAGTQTPLRIETDDGIDGAQARRFVRVVDEAGDPVAGTVSVIESDRVIGFVPTAPWQPGAYAVEVRPELEDRAGNRIDRLFDVQPGETQQPRAIRRINFVVEL